MKKAGVV